MPPKTKIFVGKLPPACKDIELRKLFERYGEVTECSILGNYAFVHMKDENSATTAISNLNNWDLNGFKISVEQSTGEKRAGGGFRGGGRGGFRGGRGGERGGFRGRGGPMRGGGRGMGRPGPYDRRPMDDRYGPPVPHPPPHMGNGYDDYYERRDRSPMNAARPPPPPVAREPYRDPYDRYESYERLPHPPPMRRAMPMERRPPPPMGYDRREDPYDPYTRAPATEGEYGAGDMMAPPRRRSPPRRYPPGPPRDYSPRRF